MIGINAYRGVHFWAMETLLIETETGKLALRQAEYFFKDLNDDLWHYDRKIKMQVVGAHTRDSRKPEVFLPIFRTELPSLGISTFTGMSEKECAVSIESRKKRFSRNWLFANGTFPFRNGKRTFDFSGICPDSFEGFEEAEIPIYGPFTENCLAFSFRYAIDAEIEFGDMLKTILDNSGLRIKEHHPNNFGLGC